MFKTGIPKNLPQLSAPYNYIVDKLDDENIGHEFVEVDPNELNASQAFTYSDQVGKVNLDDENPIWIDNEQNVLDGNHRMVKALNTNNKIKAIKLNLNKEVACRILNKIQDIFEYEQSQNMEEIVSNNSINSNNEKDSGISHTEFLSTLEEDNIDIQNENPTSNQQTLIGYRKDPIKENSIVGNFFMLKPNDGYDKYEIEFDNLLDTDSLGIVYKDSQQPIDILAKIWFPNINFEKISEKNNIPSINLKNKAISIMAKKKGYDGIKYGDKILQGLK